MRIQQSRTRVPLQYVGVSGAMAASAIFQMVSTTQGAVLAPVMTTAQKNAIASPTPFLVVADSTLGRLEYYNGAAWGGIGAGSSAGNVSLQAATPGTVQTGHINVSGTVMAGAFSGPLTGNASSATLWGTYAAITGPTQARTITFADADQTVANLTGTQTLTNKRINPRLDTVASSATPTPNGDTTDFYYITALAEAATFGAPTGTPVEGQRLIIRIKDNATARALAWNAIYRAGTDVVLPTTTVISKTMYCNFIYNATDTKWDFTGLAGGF